MLAMRSPVLVPPVNEIAFIEKLWIIDPPSYYDQPVLTYDHVTNAPELGSISLNLDELNGEVVANAADEAVIDKISASFSLS